MGAVVNRGALAVVVMGVAGCGKSTVGRLLAEELSWEFLDGDDFHPPHNVAKMQAGTPLTDDDRSEWLGVLHSLLERAVREGRPAVLACSALKKAYRRRLVGDLRGVRFVYLQGSYEVLERRLAARQSHFMKSNMLKSQFEVLEEPKDALNLDVSASPEQLVALIRADLGSGGEASS